MSAVRPFQISHSASPNARSRPAGPSRCHLDFWETKTARPALRLANNNPADNADNRFHGQLYRASLAPGQEVNRVPASYVGMPKNSSSFRHDWAYLEMPDTRGIKAFRHLHIAACFLGHNKERRFGGKHAGTKR